MRINPLSWVIVAGLVAGLTTGCSTTRPWQRGRLESPVMNGELSAMSALQREHAYSVREGAGLAMGSSGGGCGCN